MGVRVSPTPRKAPVAHGLNAIEKLKCGSGGKQTDRASNHSFIRREQAGDLSWETSNPMLAQVINAAPRKIAVPPASPAPDGSLRPSACPTRTAAADEIPSGTM